MIVDLCYKKLKKINFDMINDIKLRNMSMNIYELYFVKNELEEINFLNEEEFESLVILDCSYNKINNIFPNISNCLYNLVEFDCNNNNLTELIYLPDSIKYLDCSNNLINNIYLPTNLVELTCNNNLITELVDIPKNLKFLYCSNNKLKELKNIPNNLEELICNNNELYYIENLPQNLDYFSCINNKLPYENFLEYKLYKFKFNFYKFKYANKIERYYMKLRNRQINNEILYDPDLGNYKRFWCEESLKYTNNLLVKN